MSKRILVILEPLPYPFDARVRAEVEALIDAGYEVTVACPTGFGLSSLEEEVGGVRVLRFPAPPGGLGVVGYLREYGVAQLRLRRLVRKAEEGGGIDVVVVCNPPDLLVLLALPLKRRGAGVVLDYREISPELYEAKFGRRGLVYRLLLFGERLAFRHSDAVMTVSEPCARIARERGGVARERIFMVGNGPDPRRIFPVDARQDLLGGHAQLVLWLGAMSSQEGLERLIEAADQIVNGWGRHDVGFALVGPGDAHADIRREIDRRGLGDAVNLVGLVDDELVRAYMATADVCVGVDVRNDMNDRAAMRKVLEYMAMGRPVVQFPLQEMRRLCGDAAVYARDGDAADLARQIAELLDDPDRRAELGERARRHVWEQGLMWPDQVPALLAAVEAALEAGAERKRASGGQSPHRRRRRLLARSPRG